MPQRLKKSPVLVGNTMTSDLPVGGLDNEQELHLKSLPRFSWPSKDTRPESTAFVNGISKPYWFEFVMKPSSLAQFSRSEKIFLVDTRPWVHKLMSFSHSRIAIETFTKLRNELAEDLDIPYFLFLKEQAGNIDTPRQAGIALFLLSKNQGVADNFMEFGASVKAYPTNRNGFVSISPYFLQYTWITSNLDVSIKASVNVAKEEANKAHFHFNTIFEKDEGYQIIYHLNELGISWSIASPTKKDLRFGFDLGSLDVFDDYFYLHNLQG